MDKLGTSRGREGLTGTRKGIWFAAGVHKAEALGTDDPRAAIIQGGGWPSDGWEAIQELWWWRRGRGGSKS